MAKVIETSPKTPLTQREAVPVVAVADDQKTPPPTKPPSATPLKTQNSETNSGKSCTPDRLKVPKAFKYPERYTSPTDLMMSPVTRGLLARGRKSSMLLPPSRNQLIKSQGLQLQEVGLFPN